MSEKKKKILKPAAWLFYLVIGIEIIYMISPFALYYYSTYGPGLNFLHNSPRTAWLSGFFLPHFVKTSSFLLNYYQIAGWIMVLQGLLFFLVGAGQIYYYKFTKKGAVTGGIYKFIRHPQYSAFAVLGFGLLLAWTRFTVLIMYVTMLFVYFFLAKVEEKECEEKFGENYQVYKTETSRFLPGDSVLFKTPEIPPTSWLGKFVVVFSLYVLALTISITSAFGLRSYSLSKISAAFSGNTATIAAANMNPDELRQVLQIAEEDPQVRKHLGQAGNGEAASFLNYVVPAEWYLPDVPIEKMPAGIHGHHQPEDYDRDKYKILFTKARLRTTKPVRGADIIKLTYSRQPVVLVYVDKAAGAVTEIKTPLEHVQWGDIPTPLF